MMRSMYSGVSGLKTHQTKMDVIGNNIANVNTVAYKSMSITFNELMYQTTQKASGPNANTGGINARQIGLGVKSAAINTNITQQGATQTTNNPFDIQITGEAFFIVNNGQENFFTRDGSFYVDAVGNLCMTSNGYTVMGWGVDPDNPNQILQGDVQKLQIMSADNMTYPPEATTRGYVAGILDKNDASVNSTSGKTMNLQIYDSLGYPYTVKLNIKSTTDEGVFALELSSINDVDNKPIDLQNMEFGRRQMVNRENTFNLKNGATWTNTNELTVDGKAHNITADVLDPAIADEDLNNDDERNARKALLEAYGLDSIEDVENYQMNMVYAAAGGNVNVTITLADVFENTTFVNADNKTARELLGIDTLDKMKSIETNQEAIQGFIVNYDATTGKFSGIDGNGTGDTIEIGLANVTVPTPAGESKFENITVDFSNSNMWNNSGTSTINATSGDVDGIGSGRKMGAMIGVSIDTSGRIYGTYDNGMTKLLGQIAVAEFANASGLEKQGDNLYSATLNSGEFDGIGVDITANGGYMNTGVLEMSNVDLSQEFTEMITTQRGFQANSRVITVSDTMLEELVNLKR
ncbi:MAG: flagellar hook protein FlgE [Lachnospiraceae bacterium]